MRALKSKRLVALAVAVGVALILVVSVVVLPSGSARNKPPPDPPRLANPYRGLGAWVDMYAWSDTFTGGNPTFGPADLPSMAASGVQTLYLQAAQQLGPATALEPARLDALISAAHRAGIAVVVWYQPTLQDVATDLARLLAIARLPADQVAVDIESTAVADIPTRNAALITLSQQLRRALPTRLLGAIVLPVPFLQVVSPAYWPSFPYQSLASSYDAWLPMAYWTDRLRGSGFRDGYAYTVASVNGLRSAVGPATLISPIGGVSVNGLTTSDLNGFVQAAEQTASAGGSLYEWTGTTAEQWALLQPLRTKTPMEKTSG
ncbi:MAG: hypothetical protein ACRDZ8_09055 [Acidimicrobiales bacterium]